MNILKNLLALVGLAALIVLGVCYSKLQNTLADFDPEASRVYQEMLTQLIETKNPAAATSWRFKVEEGLTPEDVEQSLESIASEHNVSVVGELPLYKDVQAKTDQPYRFVKIFLICKSVIAAEMLDYSDAFSSYLPCRVTLIEDPEGQLWLYSLNMDMMIHGGQPLPPRLKEQAIEMKEVMLDIMQRSAEGDF